MVGISHAWETGPAKLETNLEMNFKINCYSALIQYGGCGQQALFLRSDMHEQATVNCCVIIVF